MTKYIIVAGGVMSGVGKGITTASVGKILQNYGYKTTAVKIDPYINCDAGTLRPTEHGEVWVTEDGGEIDQDLGNYERFLDIEIPKKNNMTTGQIYGAVIDKERAGKYLGETVQFIPHIPEEIKRRIKEASEGFDICMIEIGGTIGDFENIPYLFAMKSLERDLGKENILYMLITYLPVMGHLAEMKTKPTQQAIRLLAESGIFPDFIICRARQALDDVRKKKIEIYANIGSKYVISEPDVETIYDVPLDLEKDGIGLKILEKLNLEKKKEPDWTKWSKLVDNIKNPSVRKKVAIIGKYIDIGDYNLIDSYMSVNQAVIHAGSILGVGVDIEWMDSKKIEKDDAEVEKLKDYDGIIVPGGFGKSGTEGKIRAIQYARENNIPFLGLCLGMQLAVIEFARNVCGLNGANSTELDESTKYPVIDILEEQKKILHENRYGGSMRLGGYPAELKEGTKVFELYGKKDVSERHRHRYEVNPEFISQIEEKGLVFSGVSPDRVLMEFLELPDHKYFVATQSHPEFNSRFGKSAPLFYGLIKSMI